MDADPEFGAQLKKWRIQRGISVRGLGKAIHFDASTLSRIENGHRPAAMEIVKKLDEFLGAHGALIRSASAKTKPAEILLTDIAIESTRFAEWIDDDPGRLDAAWIAYELGDISQRFVHAPPQPLIDSLRSLRDRVREVLRSGVPSHCEQELLFLAGVAMELLAQVTDNIGDSAAAMRHAMAAETVAVRCGHSELQTWVAGTKAVIAEWSGNIAQALVFASRGAAHTKPGEQQERLYAIQARCNARLGRTEQARAAITQAQKISEAPSGMSELAEFGGTLCFPRTKLAYYLGSAHRIIGEYGPAQQQASDAIRGYTSGPLSDRSYGDEALARCDIAIARVVDNQVDGASEILVPVFELPPSQRIAPITAGLRTVDAAVRHTKSRSDPVGKVLREQIAEFTSVGTL